MVVGAIVALAAAILFAVLPYTLALPTNGSPITTHTRCDAALVQQFGTPKVGVVPPDDDVFAGEHATSRHHRAQHRSVVHAGRSLSTRHRRRVC